MVGFYEDHNFGGLARTIEKMFEADPEFGKLSHCGRKLIGKNAEEHPELVLGHILAISIKLVGTVFIASDDPIRKEVTKLEQLMSNRNVTDIESKHLDAIRKLLDADLPGAVALWDAILHMNPLDVLAIHQAFFGCAFLGSFVKGRDILSRVVNEWNSSMPLYGYFLGEYAFMLQETFLFRRAECDARRGNASVHKSVIAMAAINDYGFELSIRLFLSDLTPSDFHLFPKLKMAISGIQFRSDSGTYAVEEFLQALEMNRHDIFARHSLSHVYEMQGRVDEGLGLLEGSEADWNLVKRYKGSKSIGDLVDCSSLLYRLELESFSVGKRWHDLLGIVDDGIKNHFNSFIDPHVLMTCLGAKDHDASQSFMDTFRKSIRNGHGHSRGVSERIVLPLCEALQAHSEGDFGNAVDLTYPLRHGFFNFGGSNAQRDMFDLFLIDSALKSERKEHRNVGRHLLVERKAFKENSPMTDRLLEKILVSHVK
ncbi:tetratricopeptide repeat protein 38-like [Ylistrum balloti]|uniref:tetratricopeptide repeat protein 38-like n=1 Tax=Ylistrum balloti TaxID=509963 RepID=UPI002905A1A3|nr:tetratricopeptide repeat protein 38-like [Ylistrum balloti]